MQTTYLMGLAAGMLAALMMNVGKGIQKQKVSVLTRGQAMLSPEYRGDLAIWCFGLCVTAGSAVPFSFGLKWSGSPSAISAMTGIGLIGLVLYAVLVIGEKAGTSDKIGIALVVFATTILGYLGDKQGGRGFDLGELIVAVGLLLALGVSGCIVARFVPRMHGIAWGLAAGILIGLAIFIADVALVQVGGDMLGQLRTPYPWLALFCGASATVVTQFGFLKGRALEVVPAVNSAALTTPLILETVIYRSLPGTGQLATIGVVLMGVILLSTGAAARVAE